MLFPLSLARLSNPLKELAEADFAILTDPRLMKLSSKAVGFSIDLVKSVCKSNPILDAMIGVDCVESIDK